MQPTIQEMLNEGLKDEPGFRKFEGAPFERGSWTRWGTLKPGYPDPMRLVGAVHGAEITLGNKEIFGVMGANSEEGFSRALIDYVLSLAG